MREEISAGLLLGHLRFVPLPEGWTPVGAAILLKCKDAGGRDTWSFRTSADLNDEELLGALTIRHEMLKTSSASMYIDLDENDLDDDPAEAGDGPAGSAAPQ